MRRLAVIAERFAMIRRDADDGAIPRAARAHRVEELSDVPIRFGHVRGVTAVGVRRVWLEQMDPHEERLAGAREPR